MHTIDAEKWQIRTDLIIDSNTYDQYDKEEEHVGNILIERVSTIGDTLDECKKGRYITISFDDVSDKDNFKNVEEVFVKEFKKLIEKFDIDSKDTILIIGLGNSNSTPDSLGPKVIEHILVTRYLFLLGEVEDGYRKVAAFKPEVTGVTGIETKEMVENLVKSVDAKLVIVVDALASSSINRVNKTIQITDTGIHPGSGVGNDRKEISCDTLQVPVIAIGVPTIVDAVTIVSDTFQYMLKQFNFKLNNINNPKMKLVHSNMQNYLEEKGELSFENKEKIMGMLGELSEEEFKQLIYEVLSPIKSNLMVTPKEVDFMVEKLGVLIANGLNKSLHKNFNPTN